MMAGDWSKCSQGRCPVATVERLAITDDRSSSNEVGSEEEDGSNEVAASEEGIEQMLDL